MTTWILPLLADWREEQVRMKAPLAHFYRMLPGPATQAICVKAWQLARELPDSILCPSTGYREGNRGSGKDVLTDFLVTKLHCPASRIASVGVGNVPFRTVGEARAFARMLGDVRAHTNVDYTTPERVIIVSRWWHLPRAKKLLKKELGRLAPTVQIEGCGVPSAEIHEIAREIMLAWPRALLSREL